VLPGDHISTRSFVPISARASRGSARAHGSAERSASASSGPIWWTAIALPLPGQTPMMSGGRPPPMRVRTAAW
jgi:hypothetical protein